MQILAISGSASEKSSNTELLEVIRKQFKGIHAIEVFSIIRDFPMFQPEKLELELPEEIKTFKRKLDAADAVIICTPEYTHNIPAVLKNALEWITASGELSEKKVLPITFTPHEPRGKFAMESLLNSLKTMDAKIVTQLPLYKNEVNFTDEKLELSETYILFIEEALKLL